MVGPTAGVIYTGGLITPVGRIELRVPQDVLMGAAMLTCSGHLKQGYAISRSGLFAAGNMPFMIQRAGAPLRGQ